MSSVGTPDAGFIGDAAQRVTVPMPKNLAELRSHAHRHFRAGTRPLYHHGQRQISHNAHMNNIKHDDVIVIPFDDGPQEAPAVSTHTAHFIKHPLEAPHPPPVKVPVITPVRFEGQTSYGADFVKHPMSARTAAKPPSNGWQRKNEAPMGRSTYSTHYPWHDVKLEPPASDSVAARTPLPFEGVTSYNNDFIKHPTRPRTPVKAVQRAINTGPFEGATTYNKDFQKFDAPPAAKSTSYQTTLRPNTGRFQGTTEYNQQYLEHEMEKPQVLHIEPEIRGSRPRSAPGHRRSSRPGSAALSSARGSSIKR